jgi:hypothetical protein
MRPLRITLITVGAFQLILGLAFLLAPTDTAQLLGLRPAAPPWATWLFAMMAARFLGYAAGMLAAARDPWRHETWIDTMIAVQAVDWIATIGYLLAADLSLRQVSTAAFMPLIFIAALLRWHPRRSRYARLAPTPAQAARA